MGPVTGALMALTSLAACDGGDDDEKTSEESPVGEKPSDEATTHEATGSLTGVPLSGLEYVGRETAAGLTDAAGAFRYHADEDLTFSIGGLALGAARGRAELSPLDILGSEAAAPDARSNKLVLLHTLDADGDRNNGIQISDAIRRAVSERAASLGFAQTPEAFRASLGALLTALDGAAAFSDTDPRPRAVSSVAAAREYFVRATSPRKVVDTRDGQLAGFEANPTTWQFVGIPYAKPPLGALRWKAPEPPAPWSGLRHAIAWSDQAAQNPTYQALGEGGMSEDALYLNVTAPKDATNLPVMVWFHGGAFTILTSNSKQYNNPDGVTKKGVVLVTVNHRLGPFGYIAHPLLTAESGHGGSGNYGQMDLVLALTWVRDNIAKFGGDPGSVTLFGQSGGGGKTYALMNAPQAKGLFQRAICQSGANVIAEGTAAASLAAGEAIGTALFARLGVTTLEEARALPWTKIVQADVDAKIPREIYRPNVDFFHLPKTYHQNMVEGMPSDVPFVVGATSGDYESLRSALPTFMKQRTPTYRSSQFVYKFSRVPDGWSRLGLLSGHGGEVPYLFGYPAGMVNNYTLNLVLTPAGTKPPIADLNGNGTTGTDGDAADIYASMAWGAADEAVADTLQTLWTQFAKSGNPSTPTLAWPAYDLTNDAYLEIGPVSAEVESGLGSAFP